MDVGYIWEGGGRKGDRDCFAIGGFSPGGGGSISSLAIPQMSIIKREFTTYFTTMKETSFLQSQIFVIFKKLAKDKFYLR